jgi:signal transduction histidine kinase
MRERASLLQGTIDISSEPGKGTVIMVKIPIS